MCKRRPKITRIGVKINERKYLFYNNKRKLVINKHIVEAAIINGDMIDENNLNEVRRYASTCKRL